MLPRRAIVILREERPKDPTYGRGLRGILRCAQDDTTRQGHCPGPGVIFKNESSKGAHRLYGAAYALPAFIQPVQYVLLNVTTWRSSASVISGTSRRKIVMALLVRSTYVASVGDGRI